MEVNLFSLCDIRAKQSFSSLLRSYVGNNYSARRIFTVKTNFKQILNNEICSKFGFEFIYVAIYSDQRYWKSLGRNTYFLSLLEGLHLICTLYTVQAFRRGQRASGSYRNYQNGAVSNQLTGRWKGGRVSWGWQWICLCKEGFNLLCMYSPRSNNVTTQMCHPPKWQIRRILRVYCTSQWYSLVYTQVKITASSATMFSSLLCAKKKIVSGNVLINNHCYESRMIKQNI